MAAVWALAANVASADDGLRWRRTTPRASVEVSDATLSLRVPPGRAWGVESAPLAIEPGRRYRARAWFDVPAAAAGATFLRVALYARSDGRGRQRARFDSLALRPGRAAEREVDFVAPAWARAVKLRVLVRQRVSVSEQSPVRARDVELRGSGRSPRPEVLLREVWSQR